MKRLLCLLFTGFISVLTYAQIGTYRIVSIPVEKHGSAMLNPWNGGLDAPQFSPCDLNNDGIKDLFVFDRMGNKVITYLNTGGSGDTAYKYAPQYEELFPPGLTNWALIRDYNNDGVPDLFTYGSASAVQSIRVFKGSIVNGLLHFDLVSTQLKYTNTPGYSPIFVNSLDIPVIADVNGDGDLDVLAYNQFGSTISYYENQTAEHIGDIHYSRDSLQYELITTCWGNVEQDASSNSITLNISCKGNQDATGTGGGNQRHAGNSIYNIKDPVNHVVDLLNGNLGYNNLLLLRNCGTGNSANVCEWDSIYPSCNIPMLMEAYPAAYGIDVTNDGLDDILLAPNTLTAERNVKNVMLYKNTGDTSCWYTYQNDSFLVRHFIDVGSDSKPLFYDFDGDGLLDIISGTLGYFQPFLPNLASIAYYRNIGTTTQPQYQEITTDYNGFSSLNLTAMSPAFGDLDGDGHDDMIVGELNGFLYFFKNRATVGCSFPVVDSVRYFDLHVGLYATPIIYDVNGDSLNDLIVGRQDGKLSYFWNFGTSTNPKFHRDSVNNNFGSVNVTQSGFNFGYSHPYINANMPSKLFVGSFQGKVFEYGIDRNNLRSGSFPLLSSSVFTHNIGTKATVSIADINNDGNWEYLIGNSRGGLILYSDSLWDSSTVLSIADQGPKTPGLNIYPNPTKDYLVAFADDLDINQAQTDIFNIVGEKIAAEVKYVGNKVVVNTNQLNSGFYIVRITSQGKTYTGKALVQH